MLAYVFWHWPKPGIAREEYEERLCAFHAGLAEEPPAGMISSSAWRLKGASWLSVGGVYADWYLLESSCALDTVNSGAVSGVHALRHHAIASLAAAGTAGLYTPVREKEAKTNGKTVVWFAKPQGMSYEELYSSLERIEGVEPTALWRRMMVLGPTPEFCLIGDEPPALPAAWSPSVVHRSLLCGAAK
jgi:hypothetical protein